MVAGIDNAQCVVVFITKRYTEKVAGDNAEDNCQLEFNYAALRKTATRMVSVVMEERMRNTRTWGGEVAMVLGGRLYVDLCGDLSDDTYLNKKADELYEAITGIIGLKVKDFHLEQASSPKKVVQQNNESIKVGHGSGKALSELSVLEVACLVESLELEAYRDELVKNKIDGACLAECNSFEEIKEMGISMTVKAKLFFNKISDFKVNGVPLEYLHDNKAEKAKKEKLEAEEREKKVAEEKAKQEKAAAEEKAKKEKAAAEEKARNEKAAAEKAAAAIQQLPLEISVTCHTHNLKKVVPMNNSGWACDGRKLTGGCKSGLSDFDKSNGFQRWNCTSCDFDLCEKCSQVYLKNNTVSATGGTATGRFHLAAFQTIFLFTFLFDVDVFVNYFYLFIHSG